MAPPQTPKGSPQDLVYLLVVYSCVAAHPSGFTLDLGAMTCQVDASLSDNPRNKGSYFQCKMPRKAHNINLHIDLRSTAR